MTRSLRLITVVGLLQALSAFAAKPTQNTPTEYLDEKTAATVTTVAKPIVFSLERRDRAAHARDYVTLAAASVNRAGKISYVLIAYFWSTVDSRDAPPVDTVETLVVAADDRRLSFSLGGTRAADQGIALPVHAPPGQNSTPNVYRTDLATLRFIAGARDVTVRVGSDDTAPEFELWDDQRDALAAFVMFMNGEK